MKYRFEVIIESGSDEFWEEVERSSTPEELVKRELESVLYNAGFLDVEIHKLLDNDSLLMLLLKV